MLGPNGLDFVFKHFGSFKSRGKGHEQKDLRDLIEKYKEWAFIMYPSMRFEDVITKTQKFSSNNMVKSHVQKLRDQRDGVQVVGMDVDMDEAIATKEEAEDKMEEEEEEDIDLNTNEKKKSVDVAGKNQTDFDAVLAERGSREIESKEKRNENQPSNNSDFWGPDPMEEMMGYEEPGNDEADIAAMMYN